MNEHSKRPGTLSTQHPVLSHLYVRTFGSSGYRQVMCHEGAHALLPSSAGALAKRVVHGWMN